MKKQNIWVLCGGQSPEHEVSLSSARTCSHALDLSKYNIKPVCITRERGHWLIPQDYVVPRLRKARIEDLFDVFSRKQQSSSTLYRRKGILSCDISSVTQFLKSDPPDMVFIVLHGPYGEDGRMQGLFDFLEIPYTGSGVFASALAMDKIRCCDMLRSYNISTPPGIPVRIVDRKNLHIEYYATRKRVSLERLWRECALSLSEQIIVKPSRCGSSVGMTIVTNRATLGDALRRAAQYDTEILIERFIRGKEITCGVLEKKDSSRLVPVALPLTEIVPRTSTFFDYEAKYTPGKTDEITPARISGHLTKTIQRIALSVFNLTGCRDMARVDFIVTEDDIPYVLEINTIPGMTPTSLLPQGAKSVGISFTNLLDMIISSASEKYRAE